MLDFIFGASTGVNWNWQIVFNTFPVLLEATKVTVKLAIVSIFFGTIIGFFVALMKLSHVSILNQIGKLYTWIFRGIPLLVQLFIIYFGFSAALNIDFSPFLAAVIGISICGGAYIAEIIRAGILSIDKGQMEAALSLGMTKKQAMRRVIIPQTYRRLIPPLGNEFIALLKDTALASTITVGELLRTAQVYSGSTFHPFELYLSAGLIYLVLTTLFTIAFSTLEKRLAMKE